MSAIQKGTSEDREITIRFILRERIGFLRTLVQYLPPVLRKRYVETIDEIVELTK